MENKEELNYKKAYYYLFNQVTDIITMLQIIQRKAEDISIDETNQNSIEIDVNKTLQSIIDNINIENNNINNIKE